MAAKKKNREHTALDGPIPETAGALIAQGAVLRARYGRDLPVPMNADEAEAASKEFAHLWRQREAGLERRRDDMAKHRKVLDGIDERMKELAEGVEAGTKREAVQVVEVLTRQQEIHIIRVDTGEVLDRRTASSEELQPELFAGNAADGTAH